MLSFSSIIKKYNTVLVRPKLLVLKKVKSKLSPINGIIRDRKIFRAHCMYMQRRCRVKCVKDVTYV